MSGAATILLVDDEDQFRDNVSDYLVSRGFETVQARNGGEALALLQERSPDAAIVDVQMPGMDGLTLLGHLKERGPELEVILVTGQGSVEAAVEAMRKGAFHYVTKPVRMRELELVLNRALERARLSRQNLALSEEIQRRRGAGSPAIVAESPAMRELLRKAASVAATPMTVLIEGETGTGKEVLADFIHRESPRGSQVMSVVNCGALSENLVDSELFGHERGAFTGAGERRVGVIEVANKGTLFLDEIGDITAGAQVRLLRFLEKGVIRRVGSNREFPLDVRVVAATNKSLEREVAEGRFREDLFHRLRVFDLHIPALRERREDILPLARAMLARAGGRSGPVLSEDAQAALREYTWPGNVRELSHTIERARFSAILSSSPLIEREHIALPAAVRENHRLVSLRENERLHVLSVLRDTEGNRAAAARILGVSERHLYRLIRQYTPESGSESV